MARWSTRGTQNTVLIGRQANLTTELTSGLVAIPVTFEADHTQEQEDFSDLASGQFGAYEAPAPGSKSGGTVKMKGRIDALKDGYVPGPLENPGDTGIIAYTMAMIANALGSDSATATDNANFLAGLHMARNPYDAGDVTGGAVGSIDVTTDASYKTGSLVYAATDATRSPATRGLGFVATRTGAGPFNLALFESYATAAASGDNAYGTATGFLSASETWPLTVHHYGDNDAFKFAYIGCVASRLMLDFTSGKTPTFELDFVYTDRKRYSTGGGTSAPADFQSARPFLGRNNGYFTIDGSPVCGWADVKIEINWAITPIQCPNKAQGVSEFVRLLDTVAVTATVPLDSGDVVTANLGPFELEYESGTTKSLGVSVGAQPGQIVALLLPAMKLASPPKLVDANGLLAQELEFRPATYTGDDGSPTATAAADSLLRLAVA
jgi:hypothetical protein